jgi:maleylpyruvate isomerase
MSEREQLRADVLRFVEQASAAQQRLITHVTGVTEEEARAPSPLPGWTRAHVLSHLMLNAKSHALMLRGDTPRQYPGGPGQRAADIEAAAQTPAGTIVDELVQWSHEVVVVWNTIDDWDREYEFGIGTSPAWRSPWGRWIEVEVHRVDLDLGYQPSDWSDDFVREYLPGALDLGPRLPTDVHVHILGDDVGIETELGPADVSLRDVRGPGYAVLAWCLGRDVPDGTLRAREAGAPAPLPELAPLVLTRRE